MAREICSRSDWAALPAKLQPLLRHLVLGAEGDGFHDVIQPEKQALTQCVPSPPLLQRLSFSKQNNHQEIHL